MQFVAQHGNSDREKINFWSCQVLLVSHKAQHLVLINCFSIPALSVKPYYYFTYIFMLLYANDTQLIAQRIAFLCTDLSMSGGHLNINGSSSAETKFLRLSCCSSLKMHSLVKTLCPPWGFLDHTNLKNEHNFGVVLDNQQPLSSDIVNMTWSCKFLLQNISFKMFHYVLLQKHYGFYKGHAGSRTK